MDSPATTRVLSSNCDRRRGTLSCLVPALRRTGAFLKILPPLARTDRAYVLLRGGTRDPQLGCGLSRRLKICLLQLGANDGSEGADQSV